MLTCLNSLHRVRAQHIFTIKAVARQYSSPSAFIQSLLVLVRQLNPAHLLDVWLAIIPLGMQLHNEPIDPIVKTSKGPKT